MAEPRIIIITVDDSPRDDVVYSRAALDLRRQLGVRCETCDYWSGNRGYPNDKHCSLHKSFATAGDHCESWARHEETPT